MNIVARKNISSKLKNTISEIGYYSYTNRCSTLEKKRNAEINNNHFHSILQSEFWTGKSI